MGEVPVHDPCAQSTTPTTKQKSAHLTGVEYDSAESVDELNSVFQSLPTCLIMEHETAEISAAFAAVGALMALSVVILSMLWRPLP